MFPFKDKYPNWQNFPNGLRVLVVDEDSHVLNEIKAKLESCHYVVSACTKGEEALAAVQDTKSPFHVALVEATIGEGFKLLEVARHLPIILMSSTENMAIMMQGIALGAADFLQKPLSDEKLRNVWQHVVRKAMYDGVDPVLTEALVPDLKPGKVLSPLASKPSDMKIESVSGAESETKLEVGADGGEKTRQEETSLVAGADAVAGGSACENRLPAPSTPQLKQAGRMNAHDSATTESPGDSDGYLLVKSEACDCLEAEPGAPMSTNAGEAKPVVAIDDLQYQFDDDSVIKLELLDDSFVSDDNPCLLVPDSIELEIGEQEAHLLEEAAKVEDECPDRNVTSAGGDTKEKKNSGKGNKAASGRRKVKVDWTPDLHRRFVLAVDQLGLDKAIPSRILDLMGVDCLTRHNIASHLQKYRSHKRHIQAREQEAAMWQHHHSKADPRAAWHGLHSNPPRIQPRPPVAPPGPHAGMGFHPNPQFHRHVMHVWGPDPSHLWQPQMTAAPWQPFDASHWPYQQCPEAWSHPPGPGPMCFGMQRFPLLQMQPGYSPEVYYGDESIPPIQMYPSAQEDPELTVAADAAANSKPSEFHPSKEILDAAIREALVNPSTPLPLGLKPPSMEAVMTELKRQGIETLPS